MADGSPTRQSARVLIAGGGFAAVEAALALGALAGDRAQVTLIAPDAVLPYRPAATLEVFEPTPSPPRAYSLETIAGVAGGAYRSDRIVSVAPHDRYVRTKSGARLEYDALIMATGARATAGIPGAMTFRDQRDLAMVRGLQSDIAAETVRHVVFAVPSGCSWPLPAYELALLTAARAADDGLDAEVSLVTPERAPLELFGAHASRLVGRLLADGGVHFLGDTQAAELRRDGRLELVFGGSIRADRVVAMPLLRGRRVPGVPTHWWGFVPVDASGRVEGLSDVYAAGDMTTFPVKQGGLATQQADRIAETIARRLGVQLMERRTTPVVQARLCSSAGTILLRAELDWQGRPTLATLGHAEREAPTTASKVFGRYLTPYLEQVEARAV